MKRLIHLFPAILVTMLLPAMAHASALGDCSAQIKYGPPSNSGVMLCRLAYVLSYNTAHRTPDWVAYHLTAAEIHGNFLRTNDFRADPEIGQGNSVSVNDFQHDGYVPGQLVPPKDMIWNARAMNESYLLSSVVPIKAEVSRGIWQTLQQKVRDWVQARGELYIVTGPVYDSPTPKTIGADQVAVPSALFEVVFDPVQVDAIAFIIPNHAGISRNLPDYITSVNEVEKRTGLDFLSNLDDQVESLVESRVSPFWVQ
jgi:endonuclease G, mitochondrial